MILLFTDTTGNDELKELLGFLDADLKYKNLKSDIISATNVIVELIGQTIYDLAVIAYAKPAPSQAEKDLIHAVRYPIAIEGYRTFAPNKDLAHTNKGRVTRIEDKEQAPFEWMIERDNVAMERKYYKSLDDLITYLDNNHLDAWKVTESYKDTHNLFIRTTRDYDKYFPIDKSHYLLIKLAPGIRLSEDNDIKSRIGKDMYDTMKTALKAGNSVSDEDLLEKIKEALVYKSMAWAMRRLSVQLFPEGVLQSFVSDRLTIKGKRPSMKSETEGAAQHFDKDADKVFIQIEQIITAIDLLANPITITEEETFPYFDENDQFIST